MSAARLPIKVSSMRIPTFASLLLIFALQLTQLGGLAHGITHLLEQQQDSDQSLPHNSEHCELCAAYAQIGSAVASCSIHFFVVRNYSFLQPGNTVSVLSCSFAAFAARAPPCSV